MLSDNVFNLNTSMFANNYITNVKISNVLKQFDQHVVSCQPDQKVRFGFQVTLTIYTYCPHFMQIENTHDHIYAFVIQLVVFERIFNGIHYGYLYFLIKIYLKKRSV